MTLKLYRDNDYESDDNDFDSYDEVEESTSTDQDEQSDDVEFETTGFNDDDDGANDELTQTDDQDYLTDLDINDDFDVDANDIENLDSEIDVNDFDDDNYDAYFDDNHDGETQIDDDSYDYDLYDDYDDESDKNDSHYSTHIDNDFNPCNDDDNFGTGVSNVFDSMLIDDDEYASEYYTDDLPDHVIFNKRGNVYNGYDGMLVALTGMIANREVVINFLDAIRDARNVRNLTNDDLRNNAKKLRTPSISQKSGLTLVQCPNCDAPPTIVQSQYCPICNVRFDLKNATVYQDEPVIEEPEKKSNAKYYVSVVFLIVLIIYLWMS